jgi:hypothetical protein
MVSGQALGASRGVHRDFLWPTIAPTPGRRGPVATGRR